LAPDAVTTQVVTLGDIRVTPAANNGIINNLDAVDMVRLLPGSANPLPYNPAGDIRQTGTNGGIINNLDAVDFVAILNGPSGAGVSAVPEPASIGLAIFASMGLIARRRRV
jgi:hypothetical protein